MNVNDQQMGDVTAFTMATKSSSITDISYDSSTNYGHENDPSLTSKLICRWDTDNTNKSMDKHCFLSMLANADTNQWTDAQQ